MEGVDDMTIQFKERVYNFKEYKSLRQSLRNSLTYPERILWNKLKNQVTGFKFRRQHGVGSYVADFYCPKVKVVVELDGDIHGIDNRMVYDSERDKFFSSKGILVLRYQNKEILNNLEAVWNDIKNHCDELSTTPAPLLSKEGIKIKTP